MTIPRSTIMIRLLDSCIRILANEGMRNLFIDAVKWGDQGFQELGKWLSLRDPDVYRTELTRS